MKTVLLVLAAVGSFLVLPTICVIDWVCRHGWDSLWRL